MPIFTLEYSPRVSRSVLLAKDEFGLSNSFIITNNEKAAEIVSSPDFRTALLKNIAQSDFQELEESLHEAFGENISDLILLEAYLENFEEIFQISESELSAVSQIVQKELFHILLISLESKAHGAIASLRTAFNWSIIILAMIFPIILWMAV